MNRTIRRRLGATCVLATISLAGVASFASASTEPPSTEPMGTEAMGTEAMGTESMGEPMAGPYGPLCAAVPADGEGSVDGMADDPVATAASNNPLLTTLVAAVTAAELGDTLNTGGPFTVFAPVNSAFDKIDPATLESVLADTETLTSILTYHVIPEQLSAADLVAGGAFATVNGAELSFAQVGETIVINGGASAVQCADVPTANATVFLIDTVLMPEG
jgi:uncharacterized surface protein with fasciclin (FAS1) repeats